ncbi:MAG: DedA family protein [Pseudomonadota bacterium]|nr:DedA family protein [Pseudomonadota bacterium]
MSEVSIEGFTTKFHDTVSTEIERFQPLLEEYGLPMVFGSIAIESLGIPAPGQTLLMVNALLSNRLGTDIVTLLGVAWVAAVSGNTAGYLLGRWAGNRILGWFGPGNRHLLRVEQFFRRYGVIVIVFSRFVDGFRQLASLVAGTLRMPWWPFFGATIVGATLWVGVWGFGAYLLERDFHRIAGWAKALGPETWVVSLALLVALAIYLVKGRNREPADSHRHESTR